MYPITCHEGTQEKWMCRVPAPLISVLDKVGGQCHTPATLPPVKRIGTHCTGFWVGLRVSLARYAKSCNCQGSNSGPSSLRQVATLTAPSWLTHDFLTHTKLQKRNKCAELQVALFATWYCRRFGQYHRTKSKLNGVIPKTFTVII